MPRGKKTDIKLRKKVIAEKINTLGSTRDIEKTTGVPSETVAKIIREEFAQVCSKSKSVADLIDTNNTLQSLADARLNELLAKKEEKLRASDLVTIRESAFKQNQLLQGRATENIGGLGVILKDIQGIEKK